MEIKREGLTSVRLCLGGDGLGGGEAGSFSIGGVSSDMWGPEHSPSQLPNWDSHGCPTGLPPA